MSKTSQASTTVAFSSGDPAGSQPTLSVMVDEEATAATSPYLPGARVILLLIGRGDAAITTSSLGCSVSLIAANQTMTYSETLTVIKAKDLNLSYQAKGTPDIVWTALKGATGAIALDSNDRSKVVFAREVTMGVCTVTYPIEYDKYQLQSLSGLKAIVLFEASDSRDCSLELEIKQPDSTKYNLTLTIEDYSISGQIIAGAEVVITGPNGYRWSGVSTAAGQIILFGLSAGEYTLTATAINYQNSSSDILANDRFTL